MKTTSQVTACIACGSKDVSLDSMAFMAEEAWFPICGACGPSLERVFGDPSFGAALMQFLGVTDIQNPHQEGGAFSCIVPDGGAPLDIGARMEDFDLYCVFLGQRIRALRSSGTGNAGN
jgi:hypothetical protein